MWRFLAGIGMNTLSPILDAIAYQMSKEHNGDLGFQRMFSLVRAIWQLSTHKRRERKTQKNIAAVIFRSNEIIPAYAVFFSEYVMRSHYAVQAFQVQCS